MSSNMSDITRVGVCPQCKSLCTSDMWNKKAQKCNDCAKKRKYNNVPTMVGSVPFDSQAEAAYYRDLLKRLSAGEIGPIILQPEFPIVVNGIRVATYYSDFQYTELATRDIVTIDVKGVATPLYRLKKKLVEALYGITITEVRTARKKHPYADNNRPERPSAEHAETRALPRTHRASPNRRTA